MYLRGFQVERAAPVDVRASQTPPPRRPTQPAQTIRSGGTGNASIGPWKMTRPPCLHPAREVVRGPRTRVSWSFDDGRFPVGDELTG